MNLARRDRAATLVAFALLGTSICLPTLVGLLAVDVTGDLGFDDSAFGMVVGAFWLVSAISAPLCGRWIDSRGWPTGALWGPLVIAATLFACAVFVHSWAALVMVFATGGLGYALCSPTSNIVVMKAVRPGRQASALGFKQTAPPVVMAVAGASLPALAHAHGWRTAMAVGMAFPFLAGLGAWLLIVSGLSTKRELGVEPTGIVPVAHGEGWLSESAMPGPNVVDVAVSVARPRPLRPLPVVLAAGLGTVAVATVTGFGVLTLVDSGLSTVMAAGVVSGASMVSVLARVFSGAYLDRRPTEDVSPLLALMTMASVSLAIVSVGILAAPEFSGSAAQFLVVVGVASSLVAAWTWPALLLLAVVRRADGPGAASGLLQLGSGIGSAVGPLAFGALSDAGGRGWGWVLMAVGTGIAAGLVFVSAQ